MKIVYKLIMVFGVLAALAGLECILNCSCNLVAYPVPQTIKIVDNTKIEVPEEETVIPEPSKELTLLVYMAADNDLESHAIRNLKEMERAECEHLNVLVLLDRSENYDETNGNWADTRLFELNHDDSNSASIISKRLDCPALGLSNDTQTELDMGNLYVLKSFIEFAKENYETHSYALIIWGHGTGWRYDGTQSRAVAIDDKTGTYMNVKDLGIALQNQELAVIGFDTCFGATLETVYELKDCSEYTVGSPGITPGAGWNYKSLLMELSKSEGLTNQMALAMQKSSSVCTTIFDNKKINSLTECFENFSKELAETITDTTTQQNVFDSLLNCKSYCYNQFPCDMFLDVFSMGQLYSDSNTAPLTNACTELLKVLEETAVTSGSENPQLAIHFIPLNSRLTTQSRHDINYLKDDSNLSQCSFIQYSKWWVPTISGNSGSLLDKLFYTNF